MAEYRLYPLRSAAGGFAPPFEFDAPGDDDALTHADGMECPLGFELWERARLVARIQLSAEIKARPSA